MSMQRKQIRGDGAADGGGSSLKLVGAEVAPQPPTISRIVPASAATGRHCCTLTCSLRETYSPDVIGSQYHFPMKDRLLIQ